MIKKSDYPWRLGLFLAAYYMANAIYQGYISKYFEAQGMTTAQLSVILAATPLIAIVFQPIWGAMGDRARSRNRVLAGLIAAACVFMMMFRVSGAFWYLLTVNILFSAVYTSIQPMGDSIILEELARRDQPFGPIRMMGAVAFAILNLVFGMILSPDHMELVVYAAFALLVMLLPAARLLPPTGGHQAGKKEKSNMGAILKMPGMARLFIMMMLLQLTYGYFYSFFSIHFTSLPGGTHTLLGLCYFLSAMSEIPFLLNSDRLLDRLGVGRLMSISAACITVRWLILATTQNAVIALLSQLLHCFGFIVLTVAMAKYIAITIPDELKASGQMLIAVVGFGIARSFGCLAGGFVASAMGSVQRGFALMSAVSGCALVIFAPKYFRMPPINGKSGKEG